jgi:hypothetical protein
VCVCVCVWEGDSGLSSNGKENGKGNGNREERRGWGGCGGLEGSFSRVG